jgi:hypothetical protein
MKTNLSGDPMEEEMEMFQCEMEKAHEGGKLSDV